MEGSISFLPGRVVLPVDAVPAESAPVDDIRYQRIEERLAWLERHVLEQDKAMLEMSRDHDALKKQLAELRNRQGSSSASSGEDLFDGNERPPHY